MNIKENYSLRHLNTFGIDVQAKYYAEFTSVDEIREFLDIAGYKNMQKLVLGGGSNILFTGNYDGFVLKVDIDGIEVIKQDDAYYYIKAGAGENWHGLVSYCIENNYSGIENLSLIPGNAGAAPMQNIGAYGVELESVFVELEAINISNGRLEVFAKKECRFGYRNSIFKNELKDQYIINSITLKLKKEPVFKTSYGSLQEELESMGIEKLSIYAVSKAVCNIRRRKLPDPGEAGNAGSFFKNPVVTNEKFEDLKSKHNDIVAYKNSETEMKLAAAWLIDQCGWKGKRFGDAAVHKDHALVLVNCGNVKGSDIYKLSEKIADSVKEKYGIVLEREVNVI